MPITPQTLLLIDMGTNLIFDIIKKIQDAKEGKLTEEEIDTLIAQWQPKVDAITEKIKDL